MDPALLDLLAIGYRDPIAVGGAPVGINFAGILERVDLPRLRKWPRSGKSPLRIRARKLVWREGTLPRELVNDPSVEVFGRVRHGQSLRLPDLSIREKSTIDNIFYR